MKKYSVNVNGTTYEVEVEEIGGGAASAGAGYIAPATPASVAPPIPAAAAPAAPVKAEPARAAAPANSAPAGATSVLAPMPGTILKVVAKVGDRVKLGQPVVVLEAMKMENDIVSPADGVVASINVAQGASVNAGDLLASIS